MLVPFSDDSASFSHCPLAFGTMQGHVALFDARTSSKRVRKLRVFDGPILAVSRCDWDLVLLATDHPCTLGHILNDVVGQYVTEETTIGRLNKAPRSTCAVLGEELKRRVLAEKWATLIGIVDFRTLRLLEFSSSDLMGGCLGTKSSPDSSAVANTIMGDHGRQDRAGEDKSSIESFACDNTYPLFEIGTISTPSRRPNPPRFDIGTISTPRRRDVGISNSPSQPDIDYTKVVSVFNSPNDVESGTEMGASTYAPPDPSKTEQLRLVGIKTHPQLVHHVMGLNSDGRILSLEVIMG